MRVAIVGSREYPFLGAITDYMVRELSLENDVVVSGGARGVDRRAREEAARLGFKTDIFLADWTGLGRRAGFVRNGRMIRTIDRVVSFWDGKSRGTRHAMDYAKSIGKPVLWFGPDGRDNGPWLGVQSELFLGIQAFKGPCTCDVVGHAPYCKAGRGLS